MTSQDNKPARRLPRFSFNEVRDTFRNQVSADFFKGQEFGDVDYYIAAHLTNIPRGFSLVYLGDTYDFEFDNGKRSVTVTITPSEKRSGLLEKYISKNLRNGSIFREGGLLSKFSEAFVGDVEAIFDSKKIDFREEDCKIIYNLRKLRQGEIRDAYNCLVRAILYFSQWQS